MISFKRKKKYSVDIKTADQILQNVLAESKMQPNTVSFENIIKKNKINLVSDNIYLIVAIAIFLFTLIGPLLIPRGSLFMSVEASRDRQLSIISHQMDHDTFTITLKGPKVDVENTYIVDIAGNVSEPISYDPYTNTLVFPFTSGECNIFISDIDGKCLHLLLSSN